MCLFFIIVKYKIIAGKDSIERKKFVNLQYKNNI